jgi:hypothetical protein
MIYCHALNIFKTNIAYLSRVFYHFRQWCFYQPTSPTHSISSCYCLHVIFQTSTSKMARINPNLSFQVKPLNRRTYLHP